MERNHGEELAHDTQLHEVWFRRAVFICFHKAFWGTPALIPCMKRRFMLTTAFGGLGCTASNDVQDAHRIVIYFSILC